MNDPADQYADRGPYGAPASASAAYPHTPPGRAPGPEWSGGGRVGRLYDANASSDERLFAMFEHLAYFCWGVGVPGVVVTLILWLIKKNESPFIDDHGRESLNMQISMMIYFVGSLIAGVITCGVLWFLSFAVPIVAIVFAIMASIAAHRGDYYRYPAVIRFF